MSDKEDRFRPRPGRIRSDVPRARKAKSFLTRVRTIARQQSTAASRFTKSPSSGGTAKDGPKRNSLGGPGVRRGRGAAIVQARHITGGWRHSLPGMRRVIVKPRFVKGAGRSGRGAAHLRYIQRDGTSRDSERGELYSAGEDRSDADAFLDRSKDDRHQFRFIVSPEDGAELGDLTGYTRELMARVETDLGTRLDWVAVNHYNTGHPHAHVVVNGRDDLGEDLVINGAYISNGIRERASELATLELGPVTEIEQRRKLTAEINQDRFTRVDRAMIEEADGGLLDLRHETSDPSSQFDRTLRLRRLGKLEQMELATEHAPGVWELNERMEPTLRELGERGDIMRTMHKALQAVSLERDPMTFMIHDGVLSRPIIGRVIDKHLTDELGENLTLVIDGIDGRTHHVSGFDPERVADVRIGGVVELGPSDSNGRPSDKAIASIAKDGIYRPSRHLEQVKFEGSVPGGDHQGFVEAHLRRLEALRRAGITERIDADQWRIPNDFAERAAAYDAGRAPQASVRILSSLDLERQIGSDGATWLDRRLLGNVSANPGQSEIVPSGFGQEVRTAMERRREILVERGDATRQPDGRVAYRRDLIASLQEREVARVGAEIAQAKALPFRAPRDGETVNGKFTGTVQLSSGKFAIVEKSHEFTLVPWRPAIDRQLGREVSGIVQGGSVSWHLGRQRGLGI